DCVYSFFSTASSFFVYTAPTSPRILPLSLHDALPISSRHSSSTGCGNILAPVTATTTLPGMDTTMSCQSGHLPHTATWGLLGAWALHDLEELVMIPGWCRRARPRLERALPWVRCRVGHALDVPH